MRLGLGQSENNRGRPDRPERPGLKLTMVVHVIDNLSPASGGPTTAVLELARHQATCGEAVAVLRRGKDRYADLPDRWRRLPIELVDVPIAGGTRFLAGAIRSRGPRIVHLHGIWDSIVRQAARASSGVGVPWVISSHGMLHPRALAQGRAKKAAYLRLVRRPVWGARSLIVLNAEEAGHARTRLGAENVHVVTPGIDPGQWCTEATGIFRRSIPQLGADPYLLFLGRLDPIKGLDGLIAAFAHARKHGASCHLVVAGPDHGAGKGARAKARELEMSQYVHFPGSLQGDMKADALAGCTAYVHRPRYEGFGISVAEAMASGRPVVTTNACHIDGAAASGAIQVVPDTDDQFGMAIVGILNAPERAASLGHRAERWSRQELAWPRIMERTERAYGTGTPEGTRRTATGTGNYHHEEQAHGTT